MRYHNITKDDMLNGEGLRVVLWVAGCTHGCPECHNPVTWDIKGGIPFAQGSFIPFGITVDDDCKSSRNGGFGSTDAR